MQGKVFRRNNKHDIFHNMHLVNIESDLKKVSLLPEINNIFFFLKKKENFLPKISPHLIIFKRDGSLQFGKSSLKYKWNTSRKCLQFYESDFILCMGMFALSIFNWFSCNAEKNRTYCRRRGKKLGKNTYTYIVLSSKHYNHGQKCI